MKIKTIKTDLIELGWIIQYEIKESWLGLKKLFEDLFTMRMVLKIILILGIISAMFKRILLPMIVVIYLIYYSIKQNEAGVWTAYIRKKREEKYGIRKNN